MSKNGMVTDFVREAVREKASRELTTLHQRSDAFAAVEHTRDSLYATASELSAAGTALGAVATDPAVSTKLKKLRKLIDEAHAVALEIADSIGVDAQREALASARESILAALKTAGIDPEGLVPGRPPA